MTAGDDMRLLREVIRMLDSLPGTQSDHEARQLAAFTGMLDDMVSGKRKSLTQSQRDYAKGVADRIRPSTMRLAANDVKLPVSPPVPEVLRNLPKKPPGRS